MIYLIKDLLTNEYYSRSSPCFSSDITLAKVYSSNVTSQVTQALKTQQSRSPKRNLIIVKAQITELGESNV